MWYNKGASSTKIFYSVSASGLGHLVWDQVPKGNRVFESHHGDYNLWCHEVVSNAARLWTEIYWGQHPDDTLSVVIKLCVCSSSGRTPVFQIGGLRFRLPPHALL